VATFGYLVYLLRANAPYRAKELQRLSAIGDADDDLLELVDASLRAMQSKYVKEENTAEGYRIKTVVRKGRTLEVRINKGPQGAAGEAYDVQNNTSMPTTANQALLSGLRATFILPMDSYFGLLFVERIGVRHLKQAIYDQAIRPAAQGTGMVIHVESFAEAKDWKTLLDPQQTLRVSELLEVKESGEDASTLEQTKLTIVAEGGLVKKASQSLKSAIVDRVKYRELRLDKLAALAPLKERQATPDAFSVEDDAEVKKLTAELNGLRKAPTVSADFQSALQQAVPVSKINLRHRSYTVATGIDRPERTFSVEGDNLPQFVYQTQKRLGDGALRNTWLAHAESILAARNVSLLPGWSKGPST
jgi:hypothetical protein